MKDGPIASISVVGGGVAAWSAAAAFAARLKGVAITVVENPAAPPQMADLVCATTPSAPIFHGDIGIEETDLVRRTRALFRLGTRFEGWAIAPYFHGYGDHGEPLGAAAFHQHWLAHDAATPIATYSAANALAAAGRFVHPADDGPLAELGYGLTLDPRAYAAYLKGYALHLGVTLRAGSAQGEPDGDGHLALRLADGARLAPDLFVDTTGAIADTLAAARVDWSRWLPCDRVQVAAAAPLAEPPPHDRAVACAAGWRLDQPLRERTLHARVTPAALPDAAFAAFPAHAFAPGRRAAAWVGNVVAIGDAAVSVEPLEALNLHLIHAHIDRIIASLPGRACAAVELADYNRQTNDEADRVRDFLALHYHAQTRPEPFWRDLAATQPPASLAHDLTLFAERGRLPIHDGETFARDSWLSVLLGQGVIPRRRDPLTAARPDVPARLAQIRLAIAAATARAPTHADYIARLEHA